MHAFAVVSAKVRAGGAPVFSVHEDHAPLFVGSNLTLVLSARGTAWAALKKGQFRGPIHGEHVRVSMARAAGLAPDVNLSAKLSLQAERPVKKAYVVVCPDAAVRYKEWDEPRWAGVAEDIVNRGFLVAVCRAPGRPVMALPRGASSVDATLPQLAQLLLGASFLVGVDSGHIHLADALGRPVVGLYGATSTITYGPFCNSERCVDRHRDVYPTGVPYNSVAHLRRGAMDSISIDDVIAMTSVCASSRAQEIAT